MPGELRTAGHTHPCGDGVALIIPESLSRQKIYLSARIEGDHMVLITGFTYPVAD